MSVRLASSAENSTSSQCCSPEANHFRNLVERFFARHAQLVFQVQVGRGEKNMQAGFCGRFEPAQRSVYIFLARARERGYAAAFNFCGYGARRIQVAGRSDRETRFEDIDAKLFDLVGKLQFFLAIHRKAGRLLAVAQSRVENLHAFPWRLLSTHTASETRRAQQVQFIMVASRINRAYIRFTNSAVEGSYFMDLALSSGISNSGARA